MASRKSGVKSEDLKQEDFLQAVIIADSFNVRFAPLTNGTPRTLLPLVNAPLLDYTLEFLSAGGVQRAIVFCCVHADQIKRYLQSSKWMTSNNNGMQVQTVISDGCMSVGDALRDLEGKSIIRSDFVLVHGDLVANLKLASIIEEHRKRRTAVKGAVMTMVYTEALPGHATRRTEDDLVVAVHSGSQRVIGYQRVGGQSNKKFVLNREAFDHYSTVQIRHDLLDPHISICAPTVLQLMADNFDFETIDDFVRGTLVNEDVLDVSMHIHVAHGSAYAARAADPTSYAVVSQDVMSRWSYPFVPDRNITGDVSDACAYRRHNVYLSRDVSLGRGSTMVENVAVGCESSVGENTIVTHSSVGKHCKIGKNVRVEHSYLWDGVAVEDDCVIENTILHRNVCVGMKSVINGALVGANVQLPAETVVKPGTKLVSDSKRNIDGMSIVPFGSSGKVFEYRLVEGGARRSWDTWGLAPAAVTESDESSESSGSEDDDGDVDDAQMITDETLMTDELASTLQRATEENISIENVKIEINSIKHAYGIEIKEFNKLIAKTILDLPLRGLGTPINAQQYFPKFKNVTAGFILLLKNYFHTPESQTDLLVAVEEYSANSSEVLSQLQKIIHHLYDECDVLSEQVILGWFNGMEKENRSPLVRESIGKFIQWLKTAEEEDSDGD